VYTGIRAAGDGKRRLAPQNDRQRALQFTLHCPLSRLRRPTGELGSVVLDRQTRSHRRAS